MKTVNEVLTKIKGAGNVGKTLTGKGSFSRDGFKSLTTALVNDTKHKVVTQGKDGKPVSINLSELIRADLKRTAKNAGYPQPSEAAVYDTCEIVATGLAEAIPHIVSAQIQCGKKFTIPSTDKFIGDIYLAPVKGKTKVVPVRDFKTKEDMGTTTITTKDSIQVRSKSPVPAHLQTKVRKDRTGKVIN